MKRKTALFSMLIVVAMIIGLTGQVFASQQTTIEVGDDGRVKIILEFKDLQEAAWAIEHISKMTELKIFEGYEDGTFRPNQPVKRVEAIVTAVRLMGLEEAAKQKSSEIKLHFKDAELIDKKYDWAKGYIIVALEQGLFDTTEDKIQPEAAASRVWAAGLLVRALGLEAEALNKMTDIPDFKDARAIPAGAVGYINVAVERGIITGYGDQTFRPNKKVTRAELATILNRTNDELDQEQPKDPKDIINAIDELKIGIEFTNKEEYEFKLNNKRGRVEAEIKKKVLNTHHKGKNKKNRMREETIKGKEAFDAIKLLLEKSAINADMRKSEIKQRLLGALGIDEEKIKELEIEIKFSNGKKVEIEID